MKERNCGNGENRLMSTKELMDYVGLGRNKAVIFGDSISARIQVGKRVLWDRRKLDKYLDSITEVK